MASMKLLQSLDGGRDVGDASVLHQLSVPVESMFSTIGLMLKSKRSSLVPHKLNYIAFIHDNCC